MISFACPACRKSFSVEDHLAGKKAECPGCGQAVAVPGTVAPAALENTPTTPPVGEPSRQDQGTPSSPAGDSPLTCQGSSRSVERWRLHALALDHDPRFMEFLAPPGAEDELARLGKYRILAILGHGGMGVVFKAEDPMLDRLVALKVMLPEVAARPGMKERFLREARAAAAVVHDHVVRIYEIEERGVPFLAMEFLEGTSLESWLRQGNASTGRQILKVGREIARGLAAAHSRGLIHRDIKPANLWLDSAAEGRVKILDFGLARMVQAAGEHNLTQSGAILGTPAYMAPEQARGEKVDGRADLFSLGVVLYRLCTAQMPFKGNNTMSVLTALAVDNPTPPHVVNPAVVRPLSDLVMYLLEKDPARRPGTADEVIRALEDLEKAEGEPSAASAASESVGPGSPTPGQAAADSSKHGSSTELVAGPPASRRRRRALLLTALALFTGLIVGGAWTLIGGTNKQDGNGTVKLQGDKTSPGGPDLANRVEDWPKEIENSIGMTLVRIPPGTFTMGSPKNEQDAAIKDFETITGKEAPNKLRALHSAEGPQHEVQISKEFWLGTHEVTQKQFKQVMGYNPSFFSKDGKGKEGLKYPDISKPAGGKDGLPANTGSFPVENVSWEEADEFCRKLTEQPAEKKGGRKYRLPTEAEWEYACRGGAPSYQAFHFGNSLSSTQANFLGSFPFGGADKGLSLERTCKVGSYAKNGFGLYDMHGNVWEWCHDWFAENYYANNSRRDPSGPSEGANRVLRGGSWKGHGRGCRSAVRFGFTPAHRMNVLGFRVALVPSNP
jgi:formylglycine-generating enzyme required for sulfatase activity